jgi:hypothetical protein
LCIFHYKEFASGISREDHPFCHILASQRNTVSNLGCFDDPDGDGTLVCEYAIYPPVKY